MSKILTSDNKVILVNNKAILGGQSGSQVHVNYDIIQPNFLTVHNLNTQDIYLTVDLNNYIGTDKYFTLFISGEGETLDVETGIAPSGESKEFYMTLNATSDQNVNYNNVCYAAVSSIVFPNFFQLDRVGNSNVFNIDSGQGGYFKESFMVYNITSIGQSILVSWS